MYAPRTLLEEPIARVAVRGKLLAPWRRRRFHAFGADSVVHKPIAIYGPWQMALGERVLILHGAWLSVEKVAWERPAPVVRIGNRVGIRPYCTISAAESITIEDDVILSAYSTVIDCDHTIVPGVPNVLQTPLETTPVHIGAGTWIGERCSILRGARIGKGCIIGAGSVVRGQIPDHSVAVGVPARVVKQLPQS
ncbi:acyltransferase [Paraconexibacter sp.]|uniref:acyltransferase n=1 Tax=Paraconexibacter sp. TaxID=2949640 RepID=UPI00356B3254